MKLLLAAATAAEIQPTLDHLEATALRDGRYTKGDWEIRVLTTGVGLLPAAFSFTRALLQQPYDFVLQAGIGGVHDAQAALGSVYAIRSEMLGDLGAEDHDRFIDIFDLGFMDPNGAPFTNAMLVNPVEALPFASTLPWADGLTVHTVSGSQPTIDKRYSQYPATVESMEGAALHYVCLQLGVPFLQVRSSSNYITPRNRSAWQIGKAIGALNAQLIKWMDGLATG